MFSNELNLKLFVLNSDLSNQIWYSCACDEYHLVVVPETVMSLDVIDFEILSALQRDGRLSNKELAAIVGLAPSSCLERVRKLRRLDVLQGMHAEVRTASLGIGLQAMIAVQLRQHSRELVNAFHAHALSLSEVVAVYHVAGACDFQVHVAVRDATHLRDFALDKLTTRPEVRHIETSLIFDYARNPELPNYQRPLPSD